MGTGTPRLSVLFVFLYIDDSGWRTTSSSLGLEHTNERVSRENAFVEQASLSIYMY